MTDDMGKPVTLMNANSGAEWPTEEDRFHVLTARVKAISHSSSGVKGTSLLLAVAIGIVSSGVIVVVIVSEFLPPRSHWLIAVWLIASVTIAALIARKSGLNVHGKPIADALLREGVCASCGYNLCDAPVSDQGLRTCPECGAAWRADRISRADSFTGATFAPFDRFKFDARRWARTRSVKDASGRLQPMCDLPYAKKLARRDDPAVYAAIVQAERDMFRRSRPWRWAAAVCLTVLTLALALGVAEADMRVHPLAFLLYGVSGVFVLYLACFGPLTLDTQGVARTVAVHGVCPACSSSLPAPNDDDPDQLVTCRTCLATWRADSCAKS